MPKLLAPTHSDAGIREVSGSKELHPLKRRLAFVQMYRKLGGGEEEEEIDKDYVKDKFTMHVLTRLGILPTSICGFLRETFYPYISLPS